METLAWQRPELFGPPTAEFPHKLGDPEAVISGFGNCCLVVHPLAMAGTTSVLWARGMLNLYTGANKLEDRAS